MFYGVTNAVVRATDNVQGASDIRKKPNAKERGLLVRVGKNKNTQERAMAKKKTEQELKLAGHAVCRTQRRVVQSSTARSIRICHTGSYLRSRGGLRPPVGWREIRSCSR